MVYPLNHELWSGNKASQGPFHWSTTSCFSGIRIRPLVDLLLTSFHIAMIECKYFSEIRNLLDYFQLKQIRFFLLFLTVIFKYLHNFFLMNLVFIVNNFSYPLNFCVSDGKKFSHLQLFFKGWKLSWCWNMFFFLILTYT